MLLPKVIRMVMGPFAGYSYERYDGPARTVTSDRYCVEVALVQGDFYRGITDIGQAPVRGPGTMPAAYLREHPNAWVEAK